MTIMDTRDAAAGTVGSVDADHLTELLTPVRSGELRKVSARCTCGWRAVGVADDLRSATDEAERMVEWHVAAEAEQAAAYAALVAAELAAARSQRLSRRILSWASGHARVGVVAPH